MDIEISIHAPRVGSDLWVDFLLYWGTWISIHAPRVGSDGAHLDRAEIVDISIHAPRVGSDLMGRLTHDPEMNFNPRSPCGERRWEQVSARIGGGFQSTLPVWGATEVFYNNDWDWGFQSTLPVWGATKQAGVSFEQMGKFQSTLPVWGATFAAMSSSDMLPFQSTLPVWGATTTER